MSMFIFLPETEDFSYRLMVFSVNELSDKQKRVVVIFIPQTYEYIMADIPKANDSLETSYSLVSFCIVS